MNIPSITIILLMIIAVTISCSHKIQPQTNAGNYQVLANLKANGDNHSLEREVDHFIYFNTKSDLNNFMLEVIKEGYVLINEHTYNSKKINFVSTLVEYKMSFLKTLLELLVNLKN